MSKDLRAYAKQTNAQLVVGFIVLLLLVGDGLIYWIYGKEAAMMGLLCIFGGMAPVVAIWGILGLIGWIAKKADK